VTANLHAAICKYIKYKELISGTRLAKPIIDDIWGSSLEAHFSNKPQGNLKMLTRYPAIVTLVLLAMTTALTAAEEQVTHVHRFDAAEFDSLRIDYRVGTLTLEESFSNTVEVELTIKDKEGKRWFTRSPDLQNMDLSSRNPGQQLRLEFTEKSVTTDWLVRLPALQSININAGVGVIQGVLPAAAANIDLGVGTITLVARRSSTGTVDLNSGVGETVIRGASSNERRSALVSSESSAHGDGTFPLNANVGVGEVFIQLK